MAVIGIDVGNAVAKLVAMDDGELIYCDTLASRDTAQASAQAMLDAFLRSSGMARDDIACIACTGMGRLDVSFADVRKGIPVALAKGVNYLHPSARTVVDLGAETTEVVRFDGRGRLEDYVGQDKCASGTGIFLEDIANLLEMSLEEMSRTSLAAVRKAEISSTCAIFVEQEVISNIHQSPPTPIEEVIAGVYDSMAARITGMARTIGIVPEAVFCGGVARNVGLARILGERLGTELIVDERPDIIAALGMARIAQETIDKKARPC